MQAISTDEVDFTPPFAYLAANAGPKGPVFGFLCRRIGRRTV
jgi:hypothetical protein